MSRDKKIVDTKKALKVFLKAGLNANLRPREDRTQEEYDLAAEILAENLVSLAELASTDVTREVLRWRGINP